MPLAAALTAYRSEIQTFQGFIGKAYAQSSAGAYLLNTQERSFIVDSVFLKIFITWESFLEKSFVSYLQGYPSAAGKQILRHVTPTSEAHAREMLTGTQKFVDWANPDIVRKLAKLYLSSGEPIEPVISSIQADLFDLKTIRNAAAHLTTSTGKSLDALASRKLNRTCTNIAVSDLILSHDPASGSSGSILDSYISILDAGAYNIANWS